MSGWRPLPGDEPSPPEPVRALVDRVLRGLGAPASGTLDLVFSLWEEVVGPALAAHAQPVAVHDGCLVVVVDDPAWAARLRWSTADVLRAVERVAGAPVVRSVELRVRPRTGS
ncbi:MAG: DUF721 domain-containing protein [Acidimicrobiales bacterium]|nr:DUF721 domain-containing protein [Acidimicrobiales bacterium]